MLGGDAPSIKVEPTQPDPNGQDARIKPDPDSLGASPGPQLEDDIYEDAGDLEFSGAEQGLYLAKVPKFLWDNWSKLDDNQEIQIGTVRVEGDLNDIKRVRPGPQIDRLILVRYCSLIMIISDISFIDESHVDAGRFQYPPAAQRIQHGCHRSRCNQYFRLL